MIAVSKEATEPRIPNGEVEVITSKVLKKNLKIQIR
jgi:hypothetical protein